MAADNQYHPVIKVAFIVEILIGGGFVAFWLWNGSATIPAHGSNWLTLDRAEQPYLYWFVIIAVAVSLIGLPVRYLIQGPSQR